MNGYQSRLSTAGLGLADVVVLVRCNPDWQALANRLSAPRAWVDRAGTDAAAITVASALLWCAAIWLAFGLLAAATSVLPGRTGRLGAAFSHRVMPAALRRVVIGAAGVSLVLSPASAVAEGIASPSAQRPSLPPRPQWAGRSIRTRHRRWCPEHRNQARRSIGRASRRRRALLRHGPARHRPAPYSHQDTLRRLPKRM
jgi:di/tricarboxylate transporter